MAGTAGKHKSHKRLKYSMVHRLAAGVSLLAFGVIAVAGLRAEASIVSITYRAALVVIIIGLLSRVVISILVSSEEMHSDKA